jgi:D-arabinose 1-dehydrogenase-like Zn-dependent alcohol dehydrogenase
LGKGGRAVIIGAAGGDSTFTARGLIQCEQDVMGSRHSTRREFIETMELLARGLIMPVVRKRTHFTDVESIFDDIIAERLLGRGALTYD